MASWVLLFVQAALAVVGLRFLRRGVQRLTSGAHDLTLMITVVAPLVLVGPMVLLIGWIDNSVHELGWVPIGGPVACGVFALACALIVGAQLHQRIAPPRPLLLGTWLSTGIVLLLIASIHELTLAVGQVAFALAAVLLWWNSPQTVQEGFAQTKFSPLGNPELAAALTCSAAQGIVALMIDPSLEAFSGALMITHAAMGMAIVACICGSNAAISVGGWANVYGVLFVLGLMSLKQLIPMTVRTVTGGDTAVLKRVAYGFGAYALEAALMLAIAAGAASVGRLKPPLERIGGVILLIVAAAWCAWRLSTVTAVA